MLLKRLSLWTFYKSYGHEAVNILNIKQNSVSVDQLFCEHSLNITGKDAMSIFCDQHCLYFSSKPLLI